MSRLAGRHPWLFAGASAVLLSVAGRPWGLGLLGWVAFVPLFLALERSRSWPVAAALAGISALGVAALAYEAAAALGLGWLIFAVLVGAAPFAVAGAAARSLTRHLPPALSYIAPALFWAVAELVPAQPWLLGRFALPLSTFGYSQAGLPAMHLARFSSVTATSVTLLLTNALVAHLLRGIGQRRCQENAHLRGGRARILGPAAALGCLALLVVGAWRTAPDPAHPSLDVAVAQPDRPTAVLAAALRAPEVRDGVLADLALLATRPDPSESGSSAPHLLLLPEGSWPHPLLVDEPGAELPPAALSTLAVLPAAIIGAAGRTAEGRPTNSAFFWNGAHLAHVYAKLHLVPISEAGLVAGRAPGTVQVPLPHRAPLLAAPFICYDIVFPATVRRAVREGAELIAVLTDDAFAARGAVPHQHLRLARFRAVENGVPLAFASNTGPSALFSANGRTVAASNLGEAVVVRAGLGTGTGPTPYVKYGNWVGVLTCLSVALLVAWAAVRAAGRKGGVPSDGRHPE